MSKHLDSSDKRRMSAAVLMIFGRLTFAIAAFYLCTYFLFQWPSQIFRIGAGLGVGMCLLLAAAFLLRDFRWLWQMPVIGIAIAGLSIAGAMFKLYYHRQPHSLSSYEFGVAVVSITVFAGSVALLRVCRQVYGR